MGDHEASSDITSKNSIIGTSFIFINNIVGAAIIGIPYAMSQCGIMGILLLALVALLTRNSYLMLIECGVKAQKFDLEELAKYHFGNFGFFSVLILMFTFAFGAVVAYVVVIGDTFPTVFQLLFGTPTLDRDIITIVLAVCIVLPLCLLRDLSSLSWTSMLSVFSITLLIIVVSIASPYEAHSENVNPSIAIANSMLFAGIGTFSFAFVCHHNCFLVFKTLKVPTYANWGKVVDMSICCGYILCSAFGLIGYISFGQFTSGDLLNNFPESNIPVSVSRLFLGITMLFTFPVDCYVMRHCLKSMIILVKTQRSGILQDNAGQTIQRNTCAFTHSPLYLSRPNNRITNVDEDHVELISEDCMCPSDYLGSSAAECQVATKVAINAEISIDPDTSTNIISKLENNDSSTAEHIAVTFLLWAIPVALAICFPNLEVVLGLTGALAASILGYVLPAVLYIKTYEIEFTEACSVAFNYNFSSHSVINNSIDSEFSIASTPENLQCDSGGLEYELVSNVNNKDIDLDDMNYSISCSQGSKRNLLWMRFVALKRFYLPLILIAFGIIAAFSGVSTIVYQLSR